MAWARSPAWKAGLALLLMSALHPVCQAVGASLDVILGQAVVLPSAYYTLVAPQAGRITKMARPNDIFKPLPPTLEAWFIEAPTDDELDAFLQIFEDS